MYYQKFSCCEEVQSVFADWELDLRPLESGSADIFSAPDPMADINLTRFDGRVHQLGSTPAGHYTIGILTSPRYPLQWNGYSVSDSCIEVFAPGDEYDSVGPGGFSALTVSVAQEILDCLAEDLGVESLSSLTGARHWYGEPLTHSLEQLKASILSHLSAAGSNELIEDTVTDLLQILADTGPSSESPPQRWRVFRRALETMNELPAGDAVSIGSICRVSGCSISTLERAFREHAGIGPKAYLLRLRLNRVRTQLRRTSALSITDIANQNGFWHMGKLAADYRRLFGELPSQTRSGSHR